MNSSVNIKNMRPVDGSEGTEKEEAKCVCRNECHTVGTVRKTNGTVPSELQAD